LTEEEDPELTREDLFGKLAGKAKEAAGSLVGNDDLARDGRLQQAQIDAEADAARDADQAKPHDGEAAFERQDDQM
jgi:uncharacterized protein YjbJ (UPF0337 family)